MGSGRRKRSAALLAQVLPGIDPPAVPEHLVVQVRPGGASGAAHTPDHVPADPEYGSLVGAYGPGCNDPQHKWYNETGLMVVMVTLIILMVVLVLVGLLPLTVVVIVRVSLVSLV